MEEASLKLKELLKKCQDNKINLYDIPAIVEKSEFLTISRKYKIVFVLVLVLLGGKLFLDDAIENEKVSSI